jgi:hypothetical protein
MPVSAIPVAKDSRIVLFHVLTKGSCWLESVEHPPCKLQTGDVAIIKGVAHTLCDSLGRPSVPITTILPRTSTAVPPVVTYGNGGAETNIVCGYLQFDSTSFNPLLPALPDVLHIRADEGLPASWLELTLH